MTARLPITTFWALYVLGKAWEGEFGGPFYKVGGEPTMHPEFHLWAYALADAREATVLAIHDTSGTRISNREVDFHRS